MRYGGLYSGLPDIGRCGCYALRRFVLLRMNVMKVIPTPLAGVLLLEPKVFRDERGFFQETLHQQRFEALGLPAGFVQDNHSRSTRGVLRGLHFQYRYPQGKLIRVVRGEIFDVAVDIRPQSPTYGQWFGAFLNDTHLQQMWLPEGMAHGFLVLSEVADVEYRCSRFYAPEDEYSLRWDDVDIGIQWPLAALGETPLCLSARDQQAQSWADMRVMLEAGV